MSKQLRELQSRKATLVKDARALTDIAAAEQRDMNDEEVAAFEALKAKIEATSAAIDREAALIFEEAQMNHPSQLTTASVITVVDNAAADPKHGFKSVGDFLKTVRQAQNPGASIDERLLIGSGRNAVAPATFGSEGSAQDGGFLVPPQFAQEIFQLSLGEDSLLPMTDNVEITGNTMAFPKDETTPWGTNGIRAYWQGEAASAIGTKPVLGLSTLRHGQPDLPLARGRRPAPCRDRQTPERPAHLHRSGPSLDLQHGPSGADQREVHRQQRLQPPLLQAQEEACRQPARDVDPQGGGV